MSNYRKLIAAVVGLAVLLLARHSPIDLRGGELAIVEIVIAIMTALAVERLPNTKAGKA